MVTKLRAKQWDLPEIPHHDTLNALIYRDTRDEWFRIVKAYEAHPKDPYLAWRYVNSHPIFWQLTVRGDKVWVETSYGFSGVEVDLARINPKTNTIDPDQARNTQTEVWMEAGHRPWTGGEDLPQTYHDPRLDVGALTFERAICKLARKVHKLYGNDRAEISMNEGREPVWSVVLATRNGGGRHRGRPIEEVSLDDFDGVEHAELH